MISKAVLECRLQRDAPDGSATDIACVGRHVDNRNWQEAQGHERGRAYLEAYQRLCFMWLDTNQTPPLRR